MERKHNVTDEDAEGVLNGNNQIIEDLSHDVPLMTKEEVFVEARQIRQAREMEQDELARIMGVPRTSISHMERTTTVRGLLLALDVLVYFERRMPLLHRPQFKMGVATEAKWREVRDRVRERRESESVEVIEGAGEPSTGSTSSAS